MYTLCFLVDVCTARERERNRERERESREGERESERDVREQSSFRAPSLPISFYLYYKGTLNETLFFSLRY